MTDEEFLEFLATLGYQDACILPTGKWAAVMPFFYTHAIITGEVGDTSGYSDRWCYDSLITARVALLLWKTGDGTGEPVGWHRHPSSGRRIARTGSEYDEHGNLVPIGQEYIR